MPRNECPLGLCLLYPSSWSLFYYRFAPRDLLTFSGTVLSIALRAAPGGTWQDIRACDGQNRHGSRSTKKRGNECAALAMRKV